MSAVKRYGHISYLVEACPQIMKLYPSMTVYVLASDFDRVTAERDALQQRLTAADERADVLEGLVGEVLDAVGREPLDLDAVLRLRARMRAALKPAEGVGDDTTLEEDREDFKKVFVRINTKQGQSISLADMIARYEKKP